jgi:putative hemolysin
MFERSRVFKPAFKSIPLFTLMLAATACAPVAQEHHSKAGMANPASENCIKLGGQLEIRQEKDGEVGYCHLPDGRVIEEWVLFRESGNK